MFKFEQIVMDARLCIEKKSSKLRYDKDHKEINKRTQLKEQIIEDKNKQNEPTQN